jgi:diguanylate cyclase (GGDEF)-like protein
MERTGRLRGTVRATAAGARNALRSIPRTRPFLLLGLGLVLGVPAGLVVVEALAAGELTLAWALNDIADFPVTYAYLTVSTIAVVVLLGAVLGRPSERARVSRVAGSLTGLFNRGHFGERLVEEMKRGHRHGHPTCVLYVAIDRLQAINDFGHQAGNRFLVLVNRTLSRCTRATDVVAWFGGEEFAVLLPVTSAVGASALSRRILAEIGRLHAGPVAQLAVSIGIAELGATATADPDDVLAAAHAALHRAKAAGSGCVAIAETAPALSRAHSFTRSETPLSDGQTPLGEHG